MSTWSYLPNAEHIDRILANIKTYCFIFATTNDMARINGCLDEQHTTLGRTSLAEAHRMSRAIIKSMNRNESWETSYYAVDMAIKSSSPIAYSAKGSAKSAILALIAWDSASNYFNLSSDEVTILAILGDNKAILMLPAILAFEKLKEIV
jgi:hypothetical protein